MTTVLNPALLLARPSQRAHGVRGVVREDGDDLGVAREAHAVAGQPFIPRSARISERKPKSRLLVLDDPFGVLEDARSSGTGPVPVPRIITEEECCASLLHGSHPGCRALYLYLSSPCHVAPHTPCAKRHSPPRPSSAGQRGKAERERRCQLPQAYFLSTLKSPPERLLETPFLQRPRTAEGFRTSPICVRIAIGPAPAWASENCAPGHFVSGAAFISTQMSK